MEVDEDVNVEGEALEPDDSIEEAPMAELDWANVKKMTMSDKVSFSSDFALAVHLLELIPDRL
jgi:hypothetical protein